MMHACKFFTEGGAMSQAPEQPRQRTWALRCSWGRLVGCLRVRKPTSAARRATIPHGTAQQLHPRSQSRLHVVRRTPTARRHRKPRPVERQGAVQGP